jgi:hypothetical protein
MSLQNWTTPARTDDRPSTDASDYQRDYRARVALERLEADERRQRQLSEQASLLNDPQARVRAWEKAHGLTLPRRAGHPVLALVAQATQLTLEQVREEQLRRASPPKPAPITIAEAVVDGPTGP